MVVLTDCQGILVATVVVTSISIHIAGDTCIAVIARADVVEVGLRISPVGQGGAVVVGPGGVAGEAVRRMESLAGHRLFVIQRFSDALKR